MEKAMGKILIGAIITFPVLIIGLINVYRASFHPRLTFKQYVDFWKKTEEQASSKANLNSLQLASGRKGVRPITLIVEADDKTDLLSGEVEEFTFTDGKMFLVDESGYVWPQSISDKRLKIISEYRNSHKE